VSRFVWALPFNLSGMGGPASSYATAGIALRVTQSHKPPHHYKVETPSGERELLMHGDYDGLGMYCGWRCGIL